MIKLKNKLKKKKKTTTWSLLELAVKSMTSSCNRDNIIKSKLNKNKKLNSQTNLILKGKTKTINKKTNEKKRLDSIP